MSQILKAHTRVNYKHPEAQVSITASVVIDVDITKDTQALICYPDCTSEYVPIEALVYNHNLLV